jgi:hypothetical protein
VSKGAHPRAACSYFDTSAQTGLAHSLEFNILGDFTGICQDPRTLVICVGFGVSCRPVWKPLSHPVEHRRGRRCCRSLRTARLPLAPPVLHGGARNSHGRPRRCERFSSIRPVTHKRARQPRECHDENRPGENARSASEPHRQGFPNPSSGCCPSPTFRSRG